MSIHFGGKKVKEMYWGGRKIKEAWYEGAKVYSGVKPGRTPQNMGWWKVGVDYVVGDVVISDTPSSYGSDFRCIKEHTSTSDNKPYYGVSQILYWEFD